MATHSTRLRLSIISSIILTIVGIFAYIYDPIHVDKFSFYIINSVLPVLGYIAGRSYRSGKTVSGLKNQGSRYKTAYYTFFISIIIGIVCYIFSPENIDKLGMYMLGVVTPSVGYILGRSITPSNDDGPDSVSKENMEP